MGMRLSLMVNLRAASVLCEKRLDQLAFGHLVENQGRGHVVDDTHQRPFLVTCHLNGGDHKGSTVNGKNVPTFVKGGIASYVACSSSLCCDLRHGLQGFFRRLPFVHANFTLSGIELAGHQQRRTRLDNVRRVRLTDRRGSDVHQAAIGVHFDYDQTAEIVATPISNKNP